MNQGFPSLLATDAISTPYGLSGQLSPEAAIQEQALNRRRQIANLLLQRGLAGTPGGKMAGRFYVADSPLQGLNSLVQAGLGAYLSQDADKDQADVASKDWAQAIGRVKAAMAEGQAPTTPPATSAAPQGSPSTPAPEQGPYNGEVGGIPQPDSGVQSQAPAIQAAPPPLLNAAAGQQTQGISPETTPGDMSQFAQASTPEQSASPPPPVPVAVPPPPDRGAMMRKLSDLMLDQHPVVRAYAQQQMAMLQHEAQVERDQANKDRAFGLDERALASRADETRALRESADAYRQAQLGTQLTGMGINAENNRQMRDIQQQNADRMASHDKAMEKIGLMNAETNRKQLEQGKIAPGYRALPNGDWEAIPNGPADLKKQGILNQDTAIMNSSTAGLDRLASSANQILNHPGLAGVTGIRGKIPDIPGTDAADARALLEKLKSQVAFDVLQDMRNNSKTGGALGNVSDAEGKRLENNLAALNSAQSLPQFKKELQSILEFTNGAKDRLRDAFNMKHKGVLEPSNPAKSAPLGTVAPYSDAAKEQRYQEWLKQQR